MYEGENCTSELVESRPSGDCWESVMRMALVNCEMRSKLERVNFAHFSNVTVLKFEGSRVRERLVLDLSGLSRLKSLEVSGSNLHVLFKQGLPRNLIFLRAREKCLHRDAIIDGSSQQLVDKIGRLEELQYLELQEYLGAKLPDMTSMISMQVAIFSRCWNVATLTGLSSKLTNLRVLILESCHGLRTCPGVGDLVRLEVLDCRQCCELEGLPDLRKLSHLRKLVISSCRLITELQGLDDLVSLEEFHARWCGMIKLPDMCKLSKLQVLNIGRSRCWKSIHPGFEKLISLKELEVDFLGVDPRKPTFEGLTMLESLDISGCRGVDVLPDLRSLIRLQKLDINFCGFNNVFGLVNLSALEDLTIANCDALERLPDMQRLTRLKLLLIVGCSNLRRWDWTWGQAEVSPRRLDCYDLPDSEKRVDSRDLLPSNSRSLDSTTFGSLSQLQRLTCGDHLLLEYLSLSRCPRIRQLSIREPMTALSELDLRNCRSLAILPDLSNFPRLLRLTIWSCHLITTLSSSGPLVACAELEIHSCNRLQYLPDLGRTFPALEMLELCICRRVMALSSSVPMPALTLLKARGCRRLSRDDLYQLQASVCPQCDVTYDEDTSCGFCSDSETSSDGGEGGSDDDSEGDSDDDGEGGSDDDGEGGSDDGEDSDGVEIHDDVDGEDFPNPKRPGISGVEPGNDLD
jgi:Leucine-rich repeat (LRR) protein